MRRWANAKFTIERVPVARPHSGRHDLTNFLDILRVNATPEGIGVGSFCLYPPKLAGTIVPPHLLADWIVIKHAERGCFACELQAGLAHAQVLLSPSAGGDVNERDDDTFDPVLHSAVGPDPQEVPLTSIALDFLLQ